MAKTKKKIVIIDVNSLAGIMVGSETLSPFKILEVGEETGVYIYNGKLGNIPIVVEGDVKVITSDTSQAQEILKEK